MEGTHASTAKTHGPRTRRAELGRLSPRSFTGETREREFHRERRRLELAAIDGPPTPRQAELIEAKIACEWQALRIEAEIARVEAETGKIDTDLRRLAAEYRRQQMLHGRDLDRTLKPPVKRAKPPRVPQLGLEEHLERLQRREGEAP